MHALIKGIGYLFEGFNLIFKPELRLYVLIPWLLNVILFVLLFFVVRHYFYEFEYWVDTYLPHWLHWLHFVFWLLFIISFLLLTVYVFVIVANLLCAPFNSFLAEKVEWYLTGKLPPAKSLYANIKALPSIIKRQLQILAYYLPRAFLLFILMFIPVLQALSAVFWVMLNAWFMAFTYIDYPTDNHHIPLDTVKKWLRDRRLSAFGFGIAAVFISMVPLLNLFIIPAAVAGATKWWLEERSLSD